jgi:hypothetical protein
LFCHSSQPDVCSLKADMKHPSLVTLQAYGTSHKQCIFYLFILCQWHIWLLYFINTHFVGSLITKFSPLFWYRNSNK